MTKQRSGNAALDGRGWKSIADRNPRGGVLAVVRSRVHTVGPLLPFIFLGTAVALLVLLPIIGHRYTKPLQDEMRNVAEPGRGLVTRLHVAIALQGASLRDYLENRSMGAARRYREAATVEQAVSVELEPLTAQLGPDVGRRYSQLRTLQDQWQRATEPLFTPEDPAAAVTVPEDLYEELLIAAARLDEAIDGAVQDRRDRVTGAEAIQQRLMLAVSVIAMLAVVMLAWLARRLREFADDAERGRIALQQATTDRERFMRGIGHDLKNPLNAIDGHAQLLEDGVIGPLMPAQRDSVRRIRRSVRSLLRLVDDLLELARAESGQLRLSIQPVDVRQVVTDAAAEHRAAAEARGHRLTVRIAEDVDIIFTDPERVMQVLGNLISNAIKYTPSGGEIVLSAYGQNVPGIEPALAVDVIDTGDGIPGDRMEEIFSEFTRLATTTSQPGAGLGLAIARRLARLLGGDVTVANGDVVGSTFTLVLPLRQRSVLTQSRSLNGVVRAGT